jgi:hypothetical protein
MCLFCFVTDRFLLLVFAQKSTISINNIFLVLIVVYPFLHIVCERPTAVVRNAKHVACCSEQRIDDIIIIVVVDIVRRLGTCAARR